MNTKLLVPFLFVASLLACLPVFAHHGGSEYDQKNLLTMKGTVTDFTWANPHCQIFLDVTDDKGAIAHWGIETNSISVMTRAGWNRKIIKAGDLVTITVAPSKRGNPIGLIRKIVLPDGTELSAGALGERPSE